MKRKLYILALISTAILMFSCTNDDDVIQKEITTTAVSKPNSQNALKKQVPELKTEAVISTYIMEADGDPNNTVPPR